MFGSSSPYSHSRHMSTTPPNSFETVPELAAEARIVSLDALRGFAMFWVVLANTVLEPGQFMANNKTVDSLAVLLGHRDWEGLSVAEFFFPLFVFIVGISTVFSIGKIIQRHGRAAAYKRLVRRAALLFLFGIFYNGGLTYPWPDVQLMGVLQRIGVCCLVAGVLFCLIGPRGLVAALVMILVGYWAWLTFVPVPGLGVPSFAKGANWAWYIDKFYLPGRKQFGDWDPEGLLSTIPAVGSCLIGVLAGLLMTNPEIPQKKKLSCFTLGGVGLIVPGCLWSLQFPFIKNLWTSSFVLVTGGVSCLALALFCLVVDIWGFRRWTPPFIWLGSNALAIYIVIRIVDFRGIAQRLVGGDIHAALGTGGNVAITVVSIAIVFLLARFMYRHQIFLRV